VKGDGADEPLSTRYESFSIAEEMKEDLADETIIPRKTKCFVRRLSLTCSGTADLASKGDMNGEFGERLAAWLVELLVWTEWQTVHQPIPDPLRMTRRPRLLPQTRNRHALFFAGCGTIANRCQRIPVLIGSFVSISGMESRYAARRLHPPQH
jgi:hypothetical protein